MWRCWLYVAVPRDITVEDFCEHNYKPRLFRCRTPPMSCAHVSVPLDLWMEMRETESTPFRRMCQPLAVAQGASVNRAILKTLSDHINCHRFCKTFSQQKHFVLQSTAPLQLKRFTVGSKMAIAASAPVLPNRIKQCCKIALFTDAPCVCMYIVCKLSVTIYHIGYTRRPNL
jgi:hypothetical protein